jgi:hypothetical protein
MTQSTKKPWAIVSLTVSMCAACSSSGGASATDGGRSMDGAGYADGENTTDGPTSVDDGSPSDGGNPDGGNPVDGSHPIEDGNTMDGANPESPQPVNLATAGDYVILAKTGISTVPTSAVTGNMGISPAAATYITGFSLTADSTNVFSTSPQVTGKVYASNYATPTPAKLTTAVGDMQLAFTDAAGRAAHVTELGAGNIGGMTLTAGVYKWGTGLLIPTNVTLKGTATDVWILQIAQDLTVSSAVNVVLAGGAVAKNVVWQVAGAAHLGTTAHFEGVILSMTSITLQTGASVTGRLLAQTAVSIDGSAVVQPAP